MKMKGAQKEGIRTIATSKPPPKARPSMAATEGFLAAVKKHDQSNNRKQLSSTQRS